MRQKFFQKKNFLFPKMRLRKIFPKKIFSPKFSKNFCCTKRDLEKVLTKRDLIPRNVAGIKFNGMGYKKEMSTCKIVNYLLRARPYCDQLIPVNPIKRL